MIGENNGKHTAVPLQLVGVISSPTFGLARGDGQQADLIQVVGIFLALTAEDQPGLGGAKLFQSVERVAGPLRAPNPSIGRSVEALPEEALGGETKLFA
jgi:hypothetical protein